MFCFLFIRFLLTFALFFTVIKRSNFHLNQCCSVSAKIAETAIFFCIFVKYVWFCSGSVFQFFIFTLLVGPEISEPPTNRTKEEKQTVDFSCVVVGYPTPDVAWTKNGLELNVTGDVRLSVSSNDGDHQLTISNVQQSDAGQYRCVANNSLDTATSSSATLTVQCVC